MFTTGLPKYAKLHDGSQVNLEDRINEKLQDNVQIWTGFEDFAVVCNADKNAKV